MEQNVSVLPAGQVRRGQGARGREGDKEGSQASGLQFSAATAWVTLAEARPRPGEG